MTFNFESQWNIVKDSLKNTMDSSAFNNWISPLSANTYEDETLIINSTSRFASDFIEMNYKEQILDTIKKVDSNVKNIKFSIRLDDETANNSEEAQNPTISTSNEETISNFKHSGSVSGVKNELTFNNLITSTCNDIAISALKRMLFNDNLNMTYLYGPAGCGKTHLLNAFAIEFSKINPSKNVRMMTAEKFSYEYIKSISINKSIEFKKSIRSNDLLIIEDLQYITTNKASQIELMHTINNINEKGGKVIITSNISPFLIEGINKELITRTSFGLLIDIQTANKELKEQFIKEKSKELNFSMNNEVVEYLASNFKNSIRELGGAVLRIFNYTFLSGNEITISFLNELLKDMFIDFGTQTEILDIKKDICKYYGITMGEMNSHSKVKKIAQPRQVAIYLSKVLTTKSLAEIGVQFGGKNHSTIIHSIKKIENELNSNTNFAKEINLLKSRF